MIAVAINATALGLLLSTLVGSAEAAMALTPIALIPQVVLGGLMVPMTTNPMLQPLMYVMPARWGFEGSIAQRAPGHRELAGVAHRPAQTGPERARPTSSIGGHFQCAIAQMASDTLNGRLGLS